MFVTRVEVNMMGLAVLRVLLVMMNKGYRELVNVIREEVNMMGLAVLRVWLVVMRNRGYRGIVNVMVTRENVT